MPKKKKPTKKRGLYDNIHAKRRRIKAGSGERMRSASDPKAPSAKALKMLKKLQKNLKEKERKKIMPGYHKGKKKKGRKK